MLWMPSENYAMCSMKFRLGVLVSRTASQKTADLIQDKHNLSTRGY